MKKVLSGVILFLVALILVLPVSAAYVACVNGSAATIAVNWTFTGAPGTLALVNNVGTSQNALLDFTIPQGYTGTNGSVGGDTTQFLFLNGTRSMTGALNMNTQQISNLVTGTSGGSAVNKTYADSLSGGSPPDLTPFLFINGSRAMTGNLSMNSKYINGLITGNLGTDAVNRSYIDSGLPYVAASNLSLLLTTNTSVATTTYVNTQNNAMDHSMYLFLNGTRSMSGNLQMGNQQITGLVSGSVGTSAINKSYVDGAVSGIGAPDLTPFVFTNGSRAMSGNLQMGNQQITGLVTGTGTSAVNRTYVDAGLPYVATTNTSLALVTNTSLASTTYVNTQINAVDHSSYLFLNGTRAMSGNLSMNSKYINGVISGALGTDAVNKSYVDNAVTGGSYVAASNASLLLTTNTSVATTTFVNTAINNVDHSSYLFLNGTRPMTGNLSMNSKYINGVITGALGTDAVNKTYVDTAVSGGSYVAANNASLLLTTNTSVATTTYVNTQINAVDHSSFLFLNGTRAMTGNLSMNSKYINGVITGNLGTDAVNRSYVDAGGLPYVASTNASLALVTNTSLASTTYVNTQINAVDHSSYLFLNGTRSMSGNLTMGGKSITGIVTGVGADAVNKTYVDNAIAGVGGSPPDLTPFLFINGTRAMTGNLSMGSKYINLVISGGLGTDVVNKSYVDAAVSGVGAPDLTPFLFINGTRSMTGNLSMNSKYINGVITGALGTDAVNRSYIDAGLPYVASTNQSIIVSGNTSFVATTNSSLMLTTNTSVLANPVSSYITLMAGSAMIPTTNPVGMDQAETTTNKNNYIFVNFTDGGSENAQWVVDMPYDWNMTDATKGKLTFNFLWTATAGSGTVKFDIAGKAFPDDAALDTALAAVGTATDTLLATGDMHISPDTTAAVVTSAGTGGNTIILKVTRDSATDTLNSDARLLGVRVKYIRTLA